MSRDKFLYRARVAEITKRYADMSIFVESLLLAVNDEDDLNDKERELLYIDYYHTLTPLKNSLASAAELEKFESEPEITEFICLYHAQIQNEIHEVCKKRLRILDTRLIPWASHPANRVFYLMLKGDYHAAIADSSNGSQRDQAIYDASNSFQRANGILEELFPAAHPSKLNFVVRYSIFLHDTLNERRSGLMTLWEAIHLAIEDSATLLDNRKFRYQSYPTLCNLSHTFKVWNTEQNAGLEAEVDDLEKLIQKIRQGEDARQLSRSRSVVDPDFRIDGNDLKMISESTKKA